MACVFLDGTAFVADDLVDGRRGVAGWHAKTLQLGRGRQCARVIQCDANITSIAYLEAALAGVMRLTALRSGVSLVIPGCSEEPIRVSGQKLAEGRFLALGRRENVDVYLPSRSKLYLVNLQLLEDPSARFVSKIKSGVPHLHSAAVPVLQRARRELSAMLRCGADSRSANEPMASSLALAVCPLLARSKLKVSVRGSGVRRAAVDRARALIDAHPERPLRLEDLCKAAGSRPRTIEYGFREFFGVTPMGYVRSVRLNKVRQRLSRSAGNPCSISTAARRWGFAHMGQFNAHYRLLFGETPSMTLARVGVRTL